MYQTYVQEFEEALEQLELNLLQEVWSLEGNILEILRQVQDLQLRLARIENHIPPGSSGRLSGNNSK